MSSSSAVASAPAAVDVIDIASPIEALLINKSNKSVKRSRKGASSRDGQKDLETAASSIAASTLEKEKSILSKSICRYGPGCTHVIDPYHKENFWHPEAPKFDVDKLPHLYICNECGVTQPSLKELQLHLERKTAWSNKSLVGCRICCLVDHKEWHEGYVTQYHKSGKIYI